MTLGNMRANGVHTLAVWCGGRWCHHESVLDMTAYPDEVPVPSFGPRMVCTVCGAIWRGCQAELEREEPARADHAASSAP